SRAPGSAAPARRTPRCLRAVRVPRVQRPPPAGPPRSRFSPFVQPCRQTVPRSGRDEGLELADAALDRPETRALDPVDAELLHGARRAHRAGKPRPTEGGIVELPCPGEVAEEAAGERVAGTRGIAHLVERIRRRPEDAVRGEKERAVLGAFDDDGARTERAYFARSLEDIVRAAKLSRLGFVDGDD